MSKKERNKRILLMGYYGFDNIGDEAVLEAIIQQLHAKAPELELEALSQKPAATTAAYGIPCHERMKPLALLRALRRCDVFAAGGGSLLQDITGSRSISYYLWLLRAAQLLHKKTFFYAQGIGPINDEKNRSFAARVLKKCDFLSVRDSEAADFLRELGITEKPIFVTCDPVLALRSREYAPMLPMGLKMGFALREYKGMSIEALAAAADHFAAKGWTIVFLPFCSPIDTAVSKLVAAKMENEAYIAEDIPLPRDMMATISACNFIVGMRLHSLVMAAACGIPFAALSYDPKIDGFCHELELEPAASASEQDASVIIAGIERELAQKGKNKDMLIARKPHWQALAAANAELVAACAAGKTDIEMQNTL